MAFCFFQPFLRNWPRHIRSFLPFSDWYVSRFYRSNVEINDFDCTNRLVELHL